MEAGRYRAEDLMELGRQVLTRPQIGMTDRQAMATAKILVEADLRGDPDHGIAGGDKLNDVFVKIQDDYDRLGFKRICNSDDLKKQGNDGDFVVQARKYPTMMAVDAKGLLGHYVALEILPEIIKTAKQLGYAKAYIQNSTHFGNCGIYSEMIAENDLAAKVTCTSPSYTKPFIEPQGEPSDNRTRYDGVKKRFGTNPMAWSIPYDQGIITIDMATTQRAVSPTIRVANNNASKLGIETGSDGMLYIGKGDRKTLLRDVHRSLAQKDNEAGLQKELSNLGYEEAVSLEAVESGLLKGPAGEDINYPLAFDEVFKKQFWVAPLGGTFFGYKGFGLNMLVELDNVIGGGEPGLIRRLDADGKPETPEWVSQTIEAYAIDTRYPMAEAKKRIGESVRTTRHCGNDLMFLPGEKEQFLRQKNLVEGIPMTSDQLKKLEAIALKLGVVFNLKPVSLIEQDS